MLASGNNSAILHFIAGNDAWSHGETEKARTHWELANQLSPLVPAISNNPAMVLITGDQPDLNRAIEIIDGAIKQSPNDPNLRETRGRILIKLYRPKEAVVELERALPFSRGNEGTHLQLAEAYQKLGLTELSNRHKALAEGLNPPTASAPKTDAAKQRRLRRSRQPTEPMVENNNRVAPVTAPPATLAAIAPATNRYSRPDFLLWPPTTGAAIIAAS